MNNQFLPPPSNTPGFAVLVRILNRSNHDSLVRAIAEQVGFAIIEGHLKPGDELNSVDLANQFNTSRTPIREALLLLEKEGLIEIPPRRRAHVCRLSLTEVRDIYAVRANLYSLMAELIVKNASDEQILSLGPSRELMAQACRNNDLEAYFWANVTFQDVEIEICGNSQIRKVLDSMMLRMLKLRYLSLTQPGRLEQSLSDHERLMRAYLERDTALAKALNRGIVLRGLAVIENSGWTGMEEAAPTQSELFDEDVE